jgi:hypothetical protein
MTDNDDESLKEFYAMEHAAENVRSGQDFVEFLELLQKEIIKDDELEKRRQLEFITVIQGELNYCLKFPDRKNLTIELPDQPDWAWLAQLFRVGAFEN